MIHSISGHPKTLDTQRFEWDQKMRNRSSSFLKRAFQSFQVLFYTSSFAKKKKKPVDFDDELKIGDVWYDNMTKITIKVQLFWRLPY